MLKTSATSYLLGICIQVLICKCQSCQLKPVSFFDKIISTKVSHTHLFHSFSRFCRCCDYTRIYCASDKNATFEHLHFHCQWSKIYLLINRKQVEFELSVLSAAVLKLMNNEPSNSPRQPEHAVSYWLLINVSSMDTEYWSLTCYTVCPWHVEVNFIPLILFLWDLTQGTTGIYQTSGAEVTTPLALEKISQMYFCPWELWPCKLWQ